MATFPAGAQPELFRHLLKMTVLKCLPPDEAGQAAGPHLSLARGDHRAWHLTSETSLENSRSQSMRFHEKCQLREKSVFKGKRHAAFY